MAVNISRRRFIRAGLAICAAPMIVRAESIMKVALPEQIIGRYEGFRFIESNSLFITNHVGRVVYSTTQASSHWHGVALNMGGRVWVHGRPQLTLDPGFYGHVTCQVTPGMDAQRLFATNGVRRGTKLEPIPRFGVERLAELYPNRRIEELMVKHVPYRDTQA